MSSISYLNNIWSSQNGLRYLLLWHMFTGWTLMFIFIICIMMLDCNRQWFRSRGYLISCINSFPTDSSFISVVASQRILCFLTRWFWILLLSSLSTMSGSWAIQWIWFTVWFSGVVWVRLAVYWWKYGLDHMRRRLKWTNFSSEGDLRLLPALSAFLRPRSVWHECLDNWWECAGNPANSNFLGQWLTRIYRWPKDDMSHRPDI